MSLFPRFSQEFSPFFRLLDEYDRATRDGSNHLGRQLKSFTPKFDVKEVKDAYELHGELPGVDQRNINVEWSDSNTLTISGHIESHRETREPAAEVSEEHIDKHDYHKPTVEEEEAGGSTTRTDDASNPTDTHVVKTDQSKEVSKHAAPFKYWVTERTVGEFHRSFNFPTRVDQDGVKANLKNGILTIVVPKAQKPQARRINID